MMIRLTDFDRFSSPDVTVKHHLSDEPVFMRVKYMERARSECTSRSTPVSVEGLEAKSFENLISSRSIQVSCNKDPLLLQTLTLP